MNTALDRPSDLAFTPTVKAVQARKGSRRAYAHLEDGAGWADAIPAGLKDFIEQQTTAYLATANAEGQPYVQHRGGPAGFLRVLDEHTIAFADFSGNRQYITTGNLQDNPKAHLFLMDYAQRQRVKLWGEARVVEGDAALLARLMPAGYPARGEQVIVFSVKAWDANCPKHIPQLLPADEVRRVLEEKAARIAALEAEVARLSASLQSVASLLPAKP
jgi:predicted pyridoxine 5'-phosphate oxidase superfamily flavin-nucleotide-binding protein